MAHYIISYDLHRERSYGPVWSLLESLGAVRLLESLWVVTSPYGVGDLREAIRQAMDQDDAVAVVELKPGSEWASFNARQPGVDWLTQNIRRY